jgi:acid phosphatase (class A)
MFIETARTGALMALAVALATGCATVAAPTSPADLPQGRPGYVVGYLQPAELPDSLALLPPPPTASSVAFAADEDAYHATRKLRDTPRWVLAAKDADLGFPKAAETFSCTLAMPISEEATPHVNMLIRRVRADASRANDKAKDSYKRRRPFAVYGDQNCTPREQLKDDSYPSGHSSIGWAWALVLAEIAPDRGDAILARGLAFGQSRIVCGVHWKSDVEAGRIVGASVVSRLHANPVFAAQLAAARKEIEGARAAGLKSPLDCAVEAQALANGP